MGSDSKRDLSFNERLRRREREDADQDEDKKEQEASKKFSYEGTGGSTDKLIELIKRAEPLIEQVNGLYNQYVAGVESRPPIERRKHLDELMVSIQGLPKPTPAYQFRYQTLNASYLTHRERWERMCKDLESGKIRRTKS
ncbi:hypothetical protein WDW37_01680 [Bdellovibrionota bacterium FG-1]